MEMYLTHNNGDRPYMVTVDGKKVEIFKRHKSKKFHSPLIEDYNIKIAAYNNVSDVFVGEIPKIRYESNPLGSFLGLEKTPNYLTKKYRDKFQGNTILIHLQKSQYVFVESCIYTIDLKGDKIQKFISPVGNNDVPYPVAYGEKYIYFLTSGFKERRVSKSIIPVRLLDPENADELMGIFLKGEYISLIDKYWRDKKALSFDGYKSDIPSIFCIDGW